MSHQARKSYGNIVLIALVALLSIPMGRVMHRRAVAINALEHERNLLRWRLAQLRSEKKRLIREREALLTDPVFIEKEARETLGLKRKGEIMLPPSNAKHGITKQHPLQLRGTTFFDRLFTWRFFPFVFPLFVTLVCILGLAVAEWVSIHTQERWNGAQAELQPDDTDQSGIETLS